MARMSRKSIRSNAALNTVKTVASILFPLITFPYISRTLLAENVGKINFGLSIVSYFSLLASLGISTYAIRECSAVRDDREKLSDVASQIFTINLITTLVSYVLLGLTLAFYKQVESYRTLIAIQSVSILAATLGADWLNAAMEDFKYITLRTVGFQVLSLVLMFVFVHQPEDYMKYAVISMVSSAGANVVNAFYRRRYCKVRVIANVVGGIEWRRHMAPILMLFVMILAQTIFNNMDVSMLGIYIGDREVGIYSTAHKIMNVINQVAASICWVIMPRMSLYFERQDFGEINALLRKVLSFNLTIGLPCVVGTIALAKDVILAFAGPEYSDAAAVLQILMIAFGFMLFGGNFLGNSVLLPARQEKEFMLVCVISAVVNVAANVFAIPRFGARGAAATTAFCECLILVLLLLRKDKRISLGRVWGLAVPPLVGCAFVAVACMGLSFVGNLWLRIAASVAASVLGFLLIQLALGNKLVFEVLGDVRKRFAKRA